MLLRWRVAAQLPVFRSRGCARDEVLGQRRAQQPPGLRVNWEVHAGDFAVARDTAGHLVQVQRNRAALALSGQFAQDARDEERFGGVAARERGMPGRLDDRQHQRRVRRRPRAGELVFEPVVHGRGHLQGAAEQLHGARMALRLQTNRRGPLRPRQPGLRQDLLHATVADRGVIKHQARLPGEYRFARSRDRYQRHSGSARFAEVRDR